MRFKDANVATKGQRVKGQTLVACAPPTGPSSCWLEPHGLLGPDTVFFWILSKTAPFTLSGGSK